jgi:glycosyltransferase involved in cell wall biosynthesis
VVKDGVNGALVDPDDVGSLATALVRILSDRSYAERLGAAARLTGEEWTVSPGVYADKVLALVNDAIRG